MPESKPIWLTEFGCGAVDKGPNAPNAFGDPKSAEDARPPFSSGLPDALIQRQMLRACLQYWKARGGAMLDFERIYIWCWDARPYPAFPAFTDIWSDGDNYATGHWLNGRLGVAAVDEMIGAVAEAYGVDVGRIDVAPPLIQGLTVEAVATMRDVLAMVTEATGLVPRDGPAGLNWIAPDDREPLVLDYGRMVREDGPVLARRRGDPAEAAGRLTLSFIDRARDYQAASVLALSHGGTRIAAENSGLVLDPSAARLAAEAMIARMARGSDTLDFKLPPSLLALEPADIVTIAGETDGPFLVGEVRDGASRAIGARAHGEAAPATVVSEPRRSGRIVPVAGADPLFAAAHLPVAGGGAELVLGAFAAPWPGAIDIRDSTTGAAVATLNRPAFLGTLAATMPEGLSEIWSYEAPLLVNLFSGHLASAAPGAVLSGVNRIAVELANGDWEVIGFADAELVETGAYRLTGLLRGLDGTSPGEATAQASVMVLDNRVVRMPVPKDNLGTTRALKAYAGVEDAEGTNLDIALGIEPAAPLSPVHLVAFRDPGTDDVSLSWTRRSRASGTGWAYGDMPLDFSPERYSVEIFDGPERVRTVTSDTPGTIYTAAQQAADFGAQPSAFTFTVTQISPELGPGAASTGAFP